MINKLHKDFMETRIQNEKGEWVEATPEPYYPTIKDRFYTWRKRFYTWLTRKTGINFVAKFLQQKEQKEKHE